jgi:hypothetical protein
MTKPGFEEDWAFIERFERLTDETPLSDEEARAVLAEAGIIPETALEELLARIEEAEAQGRRERFAAAEVKRRETLKRLEAPRSKLSRPELMAQLSTLRGKHPELIAHFRNFEAAPDEDLQSLLAEIEELLASGKDE